jgi:glycosidase
VPGDDLPWWKTAVVYQIYPRLMGLRGTTFLYAGEELGLEDALVPARREVDPGGRDGCRASRGRSTATGSRPRRP